MEITPEQFNENFTVKEIETQEIIEQDGSSFLRVVYKTPLPKVTPISKEVLDKEISELKNKQSETLAKQKEFNDKVAKQISDRELLLKSLK